MKLTKTRAAYAALAAACLAVSPTAADQSPLYSPTVGTISGLTLTNNYNSAINALATCNSGASAPGNTLSASPVAGQCWLNTSASPYQAEVYDGSSWVVYGYLDTTAHVWSPAIGGASGSPATAAQVLVGTDGSHPVTSAALSGAQAIQTITYSSTPGWNMQSGYNATITLTGNPTFAAPTNIVAGQTYTLLVQQDGTGSRTVTWNSAFDWGTAGAPTLTTTPAKIDMVVCLAKATAATAAANNLLCTIAKGF